MPTIKPIERHVETLADIAYQRISDALLAGSIEPGSRLVMDQLALQLDISRTPVRDALFRLEREGLIEPSGRRGYIVRPVEPRLFEHTYEAREAIECLAARRAAEIGKEAIAYVKAVVESTASTDMSNVRDVYEANLRIHRSFVEVTDNPVLLELFDQVWQGARGLALFADFLAHDRTPARIDRMHEPLVKALRKSPQAAFDSMQNHIRAGLGVHSS
jgi:DNA-binding GntR family transcriptional regulator